MDSLKKRSEREEQPDRLKLQDLNECSYHLIERKKYRIKLLFPEISWLELILYHILYWSATAYSVYSFAKSSQRWKSSLYLNKKKSIYGSYQDQNDTEWNVFSLVLFECMPYGILHLSISQVLRYVFPKVLCMFYISFSAFMLVKVIGYVGAALSFFVPCVMFIALYTRSKTVIWLTWCFILIGFNTHFVHGLLGYWLSDLQDGEYKTSVMVAWIILRSLSFCLDTCEEDPERNKSHAPLFVTLLAYCLYFPLLITGPYMPFTDFQEGLQKPFETWDLMKFIWIIGQLIRFSFWFWVTDTLLYFFYAHSLIYSPALTSNMNSWELAGFVYFLLVFFLFKYIVYYGLPAVFARAEGYDPPRHPRCVLLVYRISDVWRYFDHGLYRFMIKHIYLPFIKEDRGMLKQFQGSVVVFTFIYIWHGVTPAVFWWSAINFLGVVCEKLGDCIAHSEQYLHWESVWFPGAWSRRWTAVIASPFLLLSICSLVIFLSGLEIASIVLHRIFMEGFPVTTLTTVFLFYCLVHCGMELENYRQKKKPEYRKSEKD